MKLFESGQIGKLKTRNRIVMAPMGTKGGPDGTYDDRSIEYFRLRAQGGAGLIITGLNQVTTEFEARPVNTLETNYQVDRIGLLADKVHQYGAKLIVQIGPGLGRESYIDPTTPPHAASAVPCHWAPDLICIPFTKEEIKKLVTYMGRGASFAKTAKADGVELHAYGGYLMDQFMTPIWNNRTDEYGGSLENRMRFNREVVEEIRRVCGPNFPIIVKFTANHFMPEEPAMRTLAEGIEIAKEFDKMGVDAIHVDSGCYEKYYIQMTTVYAREAFVADVAKAVKEVVHVPVISQGKLNNPETAERVLQEGCMDFVATGHQFLADPEWPNKAKKGRFDEIAHCIGCNECLFESFAGRFITCAVNPICAKEVDYPITPAAESKRVLVIGGGPGGMEAAVLASKRGHMVELWEKTNELGGNLLAAGAPAFKKDVAIYLDYLKRKLKNSRVIVHMNKDASAKEIIDGGYDNVILATGSRPAMPPIPGIDGPNVITGNAALRGAPLTGKAVVIGGGLVGCEVALHVRQTAKEVTVVEVLDDILLTASHLFNHDQCLRQMMKDSEATLVLGAKVTKITPEGVEYEQKGVAGKIACDTVVVATGFRSNNELEALLEGKVEDLRVIGDAVAPRKVVDATSEGVFYALTI